MAREIKDLSGVVAKKNIRDGFCFITNINLNSPFPIVPQDNEEMKKFSRLPSCFAHFTSFTHEDWEAIQKGSFVKYCAEVVIRPKTRAVKLHATQVRLWVGENDDDKHYDRQNEENSDDGEEPPEPPWRKRRLSV